MAEHMPSPRQAERARSLLQQLEAHRASPLSGPELLRLYRQGRRLLAEARQV